MNARRIFVALALAVLGLTFVPTQVQAAPEVYGLRYMAVTSTSTNVSWFKAEDAMSYRIYVNGALAKTISDPQLITSVTLPMLLGPADDVSAEAVSVGGNAGSRMKATYRYLFDPYAPFIADPALTIYFERGSGSLNGGAKANVAAFISNLKAHGFTQVQLIGHNAVVAGVPNALTMAALRAENVMAEMATTLVIPTIDVLHGIKFSKGATIPASAARVELFFR